MRSTSGPSASNLLSAFSNPTRSAVIAAIEVNAARISCSVFELGGERLQLDGLQNPFDRARRDGGFLSPRFRFAECVDRLSTRSFASPVAIR